MADAYDADVEAYLALVRAAGRPAFETLPDDDAGMMMPPDRAARMAALMRAAEQQGGRGVVPAP